MIEEPSWNQDKEEMWCHKCKKGILVENAYLCVCAKYGAIGHESLAWCSNDCMSDDHQKWEGQYDRLD